MTAQRKEKPVVRLKRSGYQPSKAEMDGDVSLDATPEGVGRGRRYQWTNAELHDLSRIVRAKLVG